MITAEGIRLSLPLTVQRSVTPSASQLDISALVQAYSPLLFRVAHSILRSRPEAEDVVQEVFLRTLQHQQTLPTLRDPRLWLVRIAWNVALDRRRAIRPAQIDQTFVDSLVAPTLPQDVAVEQQRRIHHLLHEIERLPAKERHVLLLSAMDELTTPEIATILNRSESAVRSLLHRARTRLRKRVTRGVL